MYRQRVCACQEIAAIMILCTYDGIIFGWSVVARDTPRIQHYLFMARDIMDRN